MNLRLLTWVVAISSLLWGANAFAVKKNESWQGYPNKQLREEIVCKKGRKQVKAKTFLELYADVWVDQPEPTSADELEWASSFSNETATYPNSARINGKDGYVEIAVLIDNAGNLVQAHVLCSTDKVFNSAALNAARFARFKPATVSGKAVSTVLIKPYSFRL